MFESFLMSLVCVAYLFMGHKTYQAQEKLLIMGYVIPRYSYLVRLLLWLPMFVLDLLSTKNNWKNSIELGRTINREEWKNNSRHIVHFNRSVKRITNRLKIQSVITKNEDGGFVASWRHPEASIVLSMAVEKNVRFTLAVIKHFTESFPVSAEEIKVIVMINDLEKVQRSLIRNICEQFKTEFITTAKN